MSKKKKDKKRKKKGISTPRRHDTLEESGPMIFLKKIGIRPLIGPPEEGPGQRVEREISRQFGQEMGDAFRRTYEPGRALNAPIYFCHSNLRRSKAYYSGDLDRICLIATELDRLPVPSKSSVLDIGGGPGHLAFWMAHIWKDSNITVADRYPEVGIEWAKEIGEDRVRFVDTSLPELELLKGEQFDIVVLSRVISSLDGLDLPHRFTTFTIEDYFSSSEAARLLDELDKILDAVSRLLSPNGKVIIIESWSDVRILLLARAFERKGLRMDVDFFFPDQISRDYSALVFSRSVYSGPIQDIPLGLGAMIDFENGPNNFQGISAESIRKLFGNVTPLIISEYVSDDGSLRSKHEILEKEGLALLYSAGTNGRRLAGLCPSIAIPELIEALQDLENKAISYKPGKINRKKPGKEERQ